jgi:hypothetical protein
VRVLALACLVFFLGVASASATVKFTIAPGLASPRNVGQTGVPSSLTITNASDAAEASLHVALNTITLVPSCGTATVTTGDCPAASVDPSVLRLSANGVGRSGTACAGTNFTTGIVDAAQGKYQLTPSAPVMLTDANTGGATASCTIDFTVDVLKRPTRDADTGTPGIQTDEVGFAYGTASNSTTGSSHGTNQVSIDAGNVSIATQVSPSSITLGDSFHDRATLGSPATGAATPSGTVTFNVYGPGDSTCSAAPVFTSLNPVSGAAPTATSSEFTPTATGTYRVIATYNGDANYNPALTACGDPGEAVTASPPTAPSNTMVPAISGAAAQGQRLSTSDGSWTGRPGSFAYRWQDCDAAGNGCTDIAGATSSTYRLAATDVGHTIRAVVTATNAIGSTEASSDKTAIVTPPPVRLSGVSLSPRSFLASRGTTLNATLSRPATVTVVVTHKVTGHVARGRCSRKAKTGKRCTLNVRDARRTFNGLAGPNKFLLKVKSLRPGAYTATVTARDSGGTASVSRLNFTIKKQ